MKQCIISSNDWFQYYFSFVCAYIQTIFFSLLKIRPTIRYIIKIFIFRSNLDFNLFDIVSFYRMFFTLCLSTKGQLYWSVKMWIKCTSCIIDQRRTKCDRHTWCQLSEKPMLWQGRTLLLIVTVTYKTDRGAYENFLFGEDGAHTQFSKTSQLASISLHNESLPQNTVSQTLVRVRSLGGHVKIQIWPTLRLLFQ